MMDPIGLQLELACKIIQLFVFKPHALGGRNQVYNPSPRKRFSRVSCPHWKH